MAKDKIPAENVWINQIYNAASTKKDGLARRSIADVNKYASFQALQESVIERGFHLLETGDQYVILCNSGSITIHL